MRTVKLFKNGQSQAVRLPREFRFAGDEVYAKRVGHSVVLFPKVRPWTALEESLNLFTEDFMEERAQPAVQRREGL